MHPSTRFYNLREYGMLSIVQECFIETKPVSVQDFWNQFGYLPIESHMFLQIILHAYITLPVACVVCDGGDLPSR